MPQVDVKSKISCELYYDSDGITVQRATRSDAEWIAHNMRQSDKDEIWASHHYTPAMAMKFSIEKTIFCLSVRIKGIPAVMFGVNGETVLGNKGVIWMLATPDIKKIGYRVIRRARHFVDVMLGFYPHLSNYVALNNTVSIGWLKALGAKFEIARPYGIEGKLFRYFKFERGT